MSDGKNYKKHGKICHNGKFYYRVSHSRINVYLGCVKKNCRGRASQAISTGRIRETRPHSCVVTPFEREKDAATERLRELTLSARGDVKAVELVRSVLKDVTPEARKLMPSEDSLMHRVRKWARQYNIELTKATPEDYLIPEGEEPLIGFGETESCDYGPSTSSHVDDPLGETPDKETTRVIVVKTGFVYLEPVSGLAECEDKKPSGLIYLKGRVNGHYTALIDGQTFSWKKNISGGRLLYECLEAKTGCPVTVIVDNEQKKYELRGIHAHQALKKSKRTDSWGLVNLRRVDDDDDTTTESKRVARDVPSENTSVNNSQPVSTLPTFHDDDAGDDNNDYMDDGEDDSQMDFEPEPESIPVQIQPPPPPHIFQQKSIVVSTSSTPPKQSGLRLKPKDVVKTGELCVVCGDELIVSEKLAASEDIFRKACCYLNVKSDGEWFPKAKSSCFYSFCENCTNEVIKIHSLYKKVEEIQSLIFKKVEVVEKRIADAEIVDHWMAEAPHSSVSRFEGFRKQVLINYRNKLKLRREIRFGKKIGQTLSEIQPSSSANMFAKDPCDTASFCGIVSENISSNTYDDLAASTSPRKTRGRPKSKKAQEEQYEIEKFQASEQPIPDDIQNSFAEDDGFHHEFDDSQDAVSVCSERDVKFWEDDPSKLKVNRRVGRKRAKKKCIGDEDGEDAIDDDKNDDPDYNEEYEDDDDWGPSEVTTRKCGNLQRSKRRGRPRKQQNLVLEPETTAKPAPAIPPGRIFFASRRRKNKTEPVKPKPAGPSRSHNFQFPDALLTKDGRVFMEGIEIIKNPPGVYKPRPYSVSYSCGVCQKTVLGFWNIRNHICGHHLGLYKCHICQKEFCDTNIIERHIITAHGEPTLKDCPECGKPVKIFKTDKYLNNHRWTHLNEDEKQDPKFMGWCPPDKDPNRVRKKLPASYMCVQCGRTFRSGSAFKQHELAHATGQDSISLMCQYCGKTFAKRKGLNQHVHNCARKAQGIVNLPTYACPKCTTHFTTSGARARHIRKYHSNVTNAELPFSCPKCPRSFGTRSGFRNHKRVCVHGEKGYNNKLTETQPSSSSQSSGSIEFKVDSPAELSSSTTAYIRGGQTFGGGAGVTQYESSSSVALGSSYQHFTSSGKHSNSQQDQYHQ